MMITPSGIREIFSIILTLSIIITILFNTVGWAGCDRRSAWESKKNLGLKMDTEDGSLVRGCDPNVPFLLEWRAVYGNVNVYGNGDMDSRSLARSAS